MTVNALKKYKTFSYDKDGNPVAVKLDLTNKVMREFFESMMEDFEDTLDAIARDDEDTVSWEEVQANLKAKWSRE
ncbi:hypothetical protein [Persicitalea sp.]|uniref:hypothetical protein n=1 Tax=Persicitalea sp. TaxID=3100273 RepID=UPI003593485B